MGQIVLKMAALMVTLPGFLEVLKHPTGAVGSLVLIYAAGMMAFMAMNGILALYLGPFLFGYVPAFSLDGSTWDIVKAFILIIIGTYAYSWILSGIWIKPLAGVFKKSPAS